MIYLITGVPGSGKTLYAVSTLVQKLCAQKLKRRGKDITRRLVVDGIPDLLLPHEPMAEVVEDDKGVMSSDGNSVLDWFKWCQPGDVIVIDEVQRVWRPRGMGTKPPEMIKALETHRHLGVDFVVITQNPMLIDQNVRRLVGRHQHVRRLFGLARAAIYDWDGCSMDVHRTKSATMSFWSYPKAAYALYKSSELHTKQKQKIPAWLAVPVLSLVGGLMVAPTAFSTMQGAMTGRGVQQTVSKPSLPPGPVSTPADLVSKAPAPAEDLPEFPPDAVEKPPQLSGCVYRFDVGCRCYTDKGVRVEASPDMCESLSLTAKPLAGGQLPADTLPEKDVLAYLFTAEQRGPIHGVGMGEAHAEPVTQIQDYPERGPLPASAPFGGGAAKRP